MSEMRNTTDLTVDELIFASRMLPHFLTGMSAVEAAKAVIDDDIRIFNCLHERSSSHYVPTADERGRSYRTSVRVGDVIAEELSSRVYKSLSANRVEGRSA